MDTFLRGLRLMRDGYGLLACVLMAVVLLTWVIGVGVAMGWLAAATLLVLLVAWVYCHGRIDGEDEPTDFGAAFDAMQREHRQILERRKRAREHEQANRARDAFNTSDIPRKVWGRGSGGVEV